MVARLFYVCLYTLISVSAAAVPGGVHALQGRIKDAAGAPVQGAVITIADLRAGAVADSEGVYTIPNIPPGRHTVQVHMLSFGTVTRTIFVDGETTADFTLTESIIEREEVVITGISSATGQRRNPAPIQTARLRELTVDAPSNIIDALTRLPGVAQSSTGPAVSRPLIRGLGGNRVVTIADGIRQEGQQWGDEHGIEVDDYNVSRIEVLKGPASLAYGSDALAGVVNILAPEPIPSGTLKGKVGLNYQTNNGLAALHASIAGNQNGLDWSAYATGKAAHDYRNRYDGFVHNSRFSNFNFGLSAGLRRHWGYSRLSFTSYDQRLGIAEGDRDSATGRFVKLVNHDGEEEEEVVSDKDGKSYHAQLPWQRVQHRKVAWSNHIYLGNGARLTGVLGVQQNVRQEYEDVVRPDDPGLHFVLNTLNYDLRYLFPLRSGWQFTVGINGMTQRNINRGEEYLIPDYDLSDAGGYLLASRQGEKWSVSGGIRFDSRTVRSAALYLDSTGEQIHLPEEPEDIRFTPIRRNFQNLSGSFGLAYTPDDHIGIKLNIASGYRAPNIAELAANGVHEGTIRYEYGNMGLAPERSVQADLGAEFSGSHLFVSAAMFASYIDKFIYIRKLNGISGTDSIPQVNNEEGYTAFTFDQQAALLYGGELYLDLHPHPLDWLHLEHTFSYVRGRFTSGAGPVAHLPSMPPPRWRIELRAQSKTMGKWIRNGYLKLSADLYFAQNKVFTAYDTETAAPAYQLFHAGLGFDLTGRRTKPWCSMSIALRNLFDTPYQYHLSRLRYAPVNYASGRQGIFDMGRNLSVSVTFPMQFK